MKIIISGPGLQPIEKVYDKPTKAYEILKEFADKMLYPIYACKLNNAYRSLSHLVYHDCQIEFLDLRNQATWHVYQNSLILMYIKAVHDVLGKDVNISINNSLNKGLYTTLNVNFTFEDVKSIAKRMDYLKNKDIPIIKEHLSYEDALVLSQKLKLKETEKLLNSLKVIDTVEIYSLDDETEIFYDFMVPSTAYLQYFELRPYKNGILLRYPHPENPTVIPEYEDQSLLYNAFAEANKWGNLMHIKYVEDLNKKVNSKDYEDLFYMQEALHEKKISDIADDIKQRNSRVVLICGPSSSGKTTFAKRLCIQLRVNGIKTLYLGTDDYFVEKDEKPVDENGEVDLECIEAVDCNLFVSNLKDLLDYKEVDLPTFDFVNNTKIFGKRISKLQKGEVIVIEGIHALNPLLTKGINEEDKYKIYISPFTPIGIDHHNRIPTTDARMLRRLVRDNQFRGRKPQDVIDEWMKVRKAENTNIFPNSSQADVFFNSNCIYELAVLKKYATPLLKSINRSMPQYAEAQRILDFLRFFESIKDDSNIVNNSIIREFIGGSVLVK